MKELLVTLNKISRLDLSGYPVEELNRYISEIGHSLQIEYTLHPTSPIIRARRNETDDEQFTSREQLGYRPEKYNTSFQRASTPNQTMFYGSIQPSFVGSDDIDKPRLAACVEASDTFRNNRFIADEKITFSRWEVVAPIKVMLIIPTVKGSNQN